MTAETPETRDQLFHRKALAEEDESMRQIYTEMMYAARRIERRRKDQPAIALFFERIMLRTEKLWNTLRFKLNRRKNIRRDW